RIATIKHAGHGFDLDTEGKDSWRLKRAGAKTVLVTSKGSLAMFADVDQEVRVEELRERYVRDGTDLIIAEGWKREGYPKVVVVLGVVAAAEAIPLTSARKFCAACHTIKPSYDSWVNSSHKEVTCVACHVRPTLEGFIQDKVIKGTHDVWVTFFGTPKNPEDL